ncbi:putative transcription factor 5qNCA, contains JmjC domain [Handroanthus impetiginosus]|uniref:Putative transcription factor 5qNCA, contains JmjC domain n=1 Tax=Handroanthus impetiginosus TaxID=429701 RepID=A0A2G9GIH0_9LAMI|nr:putative transcription factor 5qNCA, contains JmjC domain [Handroanthus impetiginosus]
MVPPKTHASEETSSAGTMQRDRPNGKRHRSDNNCHQCHRNDKGRIVRCTKCGRRNYCISCITKWYTSLEETDLIEACPGCRHICNCVRCLQSDAAYKDLPVPGLKLWTKDMIHLSKYIVRVLLPSLKELVVEQNMEREEEARIQGLSIRELQLPKVNFNHNDELQCNNCKTLIFDIHRSCMNCSYKLCVSCCSEARDASSQGNGSSGAASRCLGNVNLPSGWELMEKGKIACLPGDMGVCGNGNLELNSIYPGHWLSELLMKADAIAKVSSSDAFEDSEGAQSCLRSARGNGTENETLCRAVSQKENIDDYSHFQWHLSNGEPVNVPDVLSRTLGLSWEPMVMWRACRKSRQTDHSRILDLSVLNCLNWCEERINIHQFFRGYVDGLSDREGKVKILALQGWPPAETFQERLPRHFVEFMRCLPFRHYTDPQARELNMGAKIPNLSHKPDLGPKMCINYGVNQELGFDSVTNLQYALSDRVSVLMHTTASSVHVSQNIGEQGFDDTVGGALWDIFRRQDVPKLEDYLRKHCWEFRCIFSLQQMVHPIHEKAFYLTVEHKRKLKEEYGIEPRTFLQRQGDAVVIPAGCPYQIRYLKSCTNVVVNFMSPEGVCECLRLSKEYRCLPHNHKFKEDKLQVKQITLHAISQAVQYWDTIIVKTSRSVLKLPPIPSSEHKPAFEFMEEQLEIMKSGLQKEGHTLPANLRAELEERIQNLHKRIVSGPGSSSSQ